MNASNIVTWMSASNIVKNQKSVILFLQLYVYHHKSNFIMLCYKISQKFAYYAGIMQYAFKPRYAKTDAGLTPDNFDVYPICLTNITWGSCTLIIFLNSCNPEKQKLFLAHM